MSDMSQTTPIVSIIAVSYNQDSYIQETLDSIRNQSMQDFELIYCDDASQDRTVELAEEWFEQQSFPVHRVLHQENQGLCRTLNDGLSHASGRYVQLIACDDILLPHKLEYHTRLLSELPATTAVVTSDSALIDHGGRSLRPYRFSRQWGQPISSKREQLLEQMLSSNCVSGPTALYRAEVFEQLGGFDESLIYEDYDMWLRILRNWDIHYTSEVTVNYRLHKNNLHKTMHEMMNFYQCKHQILKKHIDLDCVRRQMRKDISEMILNNRLIALSADELQQCGYSLQDAADAVAELKSGRCYRLCRWISELMNRLFSFKQALDFRS